MILFVYILNFVGLHFHFTIQERVSLNYYIACNGLKLAIFLPQSPVLWCHSVGRIKYLH